MSFAREMLDAAPGRIEFDPAAFAAAIEASGNAAQACVACSDYSLAEEDVATMALSVAFNERCADICTATERTLSRVLHAEQRIVHRLLRTCVQSCTECAAECERHAQHHPHCGICARACRACAKACEDLLAAEELVELEKLEGG
jgi:hypothetical protein